MTKTFETTEEAKDYCLAHFCRPCRMKYICNYKISEAKESWRKCLGVRQGLCPHSSQGGGPFLCCTNPQMSTGACLGKQCKELPAVEVAEEQMVNFGFGANAPKGPDYKKRAAGERDE